MIFRLALRSLLTHPIRTLVLACGFGLGVGVMAVLLGVGEVVLDQARAPALVGGGHLVVTGYSGGVTSARFALDALKRSSQSSSIVASPRKRADLFLVRPGGVVPVHARGGIPSLERAIGDPETSNIASWLDSPADAAWSSPDPGDVLRSMDASTPFLMFPLAHRRGRSGSTSRGRWVR